MRRAAILTIAAVWLLPCLGPAFPVQAQEQNVCSRAADAAQPQEQIDLWTECINQVALETDSLAAAHANRAQARLETGDHQAALADFSQAIELQPDNPKLSYNRALAFAEAGKLDKAIDDLGRVIELDPDYVPAYYNRGVARYNTGDYQGAVDDFNEVLRLETNHAEAYAKRAFARKALGRHELAREDARIAKNLEPEVTVPEFPK